MKKILGIMITCLMLSSCNSFLEEDNRAGITNEKLYSTAVGYETLRANAYSSLRTIYGGTPWLLLAGTDLYQMPRGMNTNGIYEYSTLYANNGDVKTFYTNCYAGIQSINTALHYIDFPKDLSAAKKNLYAAELHFFRGYYHFLLIEQFGGIPINDEYTQAPRMNMPRATLAASYDFVISEMKQALAGNLPVTTKDGTICQDIVNHCLGKVYLTRGWDLGNNTDFTEAKNYFAKVFATRGTALKYNFETLWSPSNENNDEFIFSVQYNPASMPTLTSGNNQESLFGPYLGGPERKNKYMSTQLFPSWYVHSWFDVNDARYDASFMLTMWEFYYDYYNNKRTPGVNRIGAAYPRAKTKAEAAVMEEEFRALTDNLQNFSFPNADVPKIVAFVKKWVPGFENVADDKIAAYSTTGQNILRVFPFFESSPDAMTNELLWRKGWSVDFCQPVVKKFDMTQIITWSTSQSYRDIVLASLSETMLLYAEASIGLADYPTAQEYVNKVVARPGNAKNSADLNFTIPTTSKSDALEAFLKESGKELIGQYCGRWPELRRTKMLKTMFYKYNFDYRYNFQFGTDPIGEKLYRPIPEDAIDINEAMTPADQNPGYGN